MTTAQPSFLLPSFSRHSYEVSDALQFEPLPSSVRASEPGETAREELLLKKLGAKGWGRVHHFRNFYQQGWGDGSGKALSPRALEAFFEFLKSVNFSEEVLPSVFLTDSGGLELCWEEDGNRPIQLEFSPSGIEVYREKTGTEKILALTESLELARSVN